MQTTCMVEPPAGHAHKALPLPLREAGRGRAWVCFRCDQPHDPSLHPLAQGEGQNSSRRLARAHRPVLAALLAGIVSVAAAAQTPDTIKRILVPPPLQWNDMGVASHIAVQQTTSDLARLMGGLKFGLKPEEVSQHLPKIGGELHWADLPVAKGFAEDVRFVRMPMQGAGALRAPVTACFGAPSNLVLLFRNNALFRVSWRFLADRSCPNQHDAAAELYATYVPLVGTIAVSTHYRAGSAEVVDVSDPAAGPSIAQRGQ